MFKRIAAVALALGVNVQVEATERMYGVLSSGYADVEFGELSEQQPHYQFAMGHQFLSQWYLEFGYQSLVDGLDSQSGMKADALYLAMLGKAGSPWGELYYKLGVMNADVLTAQGSLPDGTCRQGGEPGTLANTCHYDEGIAAALVGVGFDFQLSMNSMVRLEFSHARGQQDFKANVVTVGLRYNFN
ncbi:autotransporter outer membrane beta-barrel domain-containing protein [Alteromonas aestuariivivens]|uniref:Autotransporter outer membrane beta-barrel domain-containing protein n=1 Tax=Alteromonas aestuariivivens TaxID=1938339 RepID=A0A3D8MF31_9ALTE|nr:outer membrane beta-barrel protein [Alteromonas aestuariivivens]RDV29171.1 autotransporter outer membrane beta-barrel domain-containing protein [Alteromonas aestuariivivens]